MSTATETIEGLVRKEYKYGFYTDLEADAAPPGLNEDIVRLISAKKNEPPFMLEWRLKAFRHWLTMKEPTWPHVHYPPIDYQKSVYYSAPKKKGEGPKSLEEVDPKLLETYEKLGIPLKERGRLAGVAVDAVFDSVSVGTTFQKQLAEKGIIFCSFTEAIHNHPELVNPHDSPKRSNPAFRAFFWLFFLPRKRRAQIPITARPNPAKMFPPKK